MNRINLSAAGLAMAVTLLIIPETVRAEPAIVVEGTGDPRIEVSYADLNLTGAAGRKALSNRVRQAAERLCIDGVAEPLKFEMNERACRDRAIEGASAQMRTAEANFGSSAVAAAASTISVVRR